MDKLVEKPKTPALVWVIAIYYFVVFIGLLSAAFMFSVVYPNIKVPDELRELYGTDRRILMAVGMIIDFVAVITLLLLKRVAVTWWLISIVFSVLNIIYNAATSDVFIEVLKDRGLSMLAGFIVTVAVYVYARRLAAKGILQ